ncbi:MAG: hypothetical protein V4657_09330 [Pseudomonadota bacterium]
MENVINGKRRQSLSPAEKTILRNALHTEGSLSGDYLASVRIRQKLGLAPLASEKE